MVCNLNNIHSQNTRQKHHLHVAIGHSDLYATSFYCTSIRIWNDILKKHWYFVVIQHSNVHFNITYNTIIYPWAILNLFYYFFTFCFP